MISDLDSVNSADFEDFLHEFNLEESKLEIEFETFIMPHTEGNIFTDDLTTSSFIKDIIETSSRKIRANLNKMLTSFDKYSSQYFLSKP